MSESMQQRWNNGKLPGLDCILYPDGSLVILNVYSSINAETGKRRVYISPLCDSTIQSVEKYIEDIWIEVTVHTSHFILPNGDCIKFGEGCMGNEGFVCCEDASGKLKWAFFCGSLNPFCDAELETASSIRVTSTNEYTMVIDLERPWKISSITNGWDEVER